MNRSLCKNVEPQNRTSGTSGNSNVSDIFDVFGYSNIESNTDKKQCYSFRRQCSRIIERKRDAIAEDVSKCVSCVLFQLFWLPILYTRPAIFIQCNMDALCEEKSHEFIINEDASIAAGQLIMGQGESPLYLH